MPHEKSDAVSPRIFFEVVFGSGPIVQGSEYSEIRQGMYIFRIGFLAFFLFAIVNVGAAQNTSVPAAQNPAVPEVKSSKTSFVPVCTAPSYPSPPPSTKPRIDSQCGLQGSGGPEANQNMAKNNFCASGTPTDMTIDDFVNLQSKVNSDTSIPFGRTPEADGRPLGPGHRPHSFAGLGRRQPGPHPRLHPFQKPGG
jgi:hypothetical protein